MEKINKYINHTYSYLALRKAIGWIGMLLPFVLMIGLMVIFNEKMIQPSMSHYYHTEMRDVFVGALCAVALFMFFYSGYDWRDNWAGNIAGLLALGVAFFPTTEMGPADTIGTVHFLCATLFFLTLSYFSLFLFTLKSDNPSKEKRIRNKIYIVCGIIMLSCLLALFIYFKFFSEESKLSSFVFWGESLALLAFGISWLTKGGTLYPDKMIQS